MMREFIGGGAMTPHDRRTLERYSRGERSLEDTCKHLGLTPREVTRWLEEAHLKAPKLKDASDKSV